MTIRVLIVLLCVSVVGMPGAMAANPEIEEIIVTATKREESVQDVPLAVTALSAESLDRAGVQDLRDLSAIATSFNMNSSQTESQGTTMRIRGVGTTGNNIGLESAVGIFLDGVYLSRPGVALGDLMDLETIEVLRGPQGTLFGRNTSAGALNIRTKGPNFEQDEYFANVTAGNHGMTNIQAGASGPISDTMAYRVSAAIRNQDGFLDSVTGAESRTRDRWLVRGQLALEPRDNVSVRIIADYAEMEDECCDSVVLSQGTAHLLNAYSTAGLASNGGVWVWGDSAFDGRNSNAEQFENPTDQWGVSVEVNWDISDSTSLTYIGSFRDFKANSVQHSDFVALDVFSVQASAAGGFDTFDDIEIWTHELRISGDTGRLSWLVGAYFSDEEIVENQGLGLGADYAANVDAQLWYGLGPALGLSGFAPLLGGVPLATGGTFADVLSASSPSIAFGGGADALGAHAKNVFSQEGTSISVFTHNVFHVNERLDLVLGLRWTDEEKDGKFNQLSGTNDYCLNSVANSGALNAGAAGTGLEAVAGFYGSVSVSFSCFPFATPADTGVSVLPATFNRTFEDDELVYTGKVVYAITEDINGYVSFTHGFKAGGFNLDSTAAAGGADPRFNSELIDSWELGLKMELWDRRMRLNLAAWDYEMEEFQVLEWTGTQFTTFNVPKAESQGFELEMLAVPMEGVQLNLGYTHAESEYPNDCGSPSLPTNVNILCGAVFTNSPEDIVTVGFSYDANFGDNMHWFFSANARWEDDRRTSTQPGLDFDIQDSNSKVSARIGFGPDDGPWTVELWGNNLSDKQTKNVTFNTPLRPGSRAVFLEAPRIYGLTLRWQQ